jgi:hypothetical protein
MDKSPTPSETRDLASPGSSEEPRDAKPRYALGHKGRNAASFDEADRERALRYLATCSGNARKAAEGLTEAGHPVRAETLSRWKTKYSTRYAEISAEVRSTVAREMAEESDNLARGYAQLERQAIERIAGELASMDPKDVVNAVRNFAVSRGVSTDKGAQLRGEPSQVVQHKHSVEENWRTLQRLGVVEGTAEELSEPTELEEGDAQALEAPPSPGEP